jgi:RecB family exonuclease
MSDDQFRLSVSKSKTFDQCKKLYKYVYVLHLPRKTRDYHTTGSLCHLTLETFHNYYIKGCLLPYNISMNDAFKFALNHYKEKLTPEIKKECLSLIDQYLKLISTDPKNHPVKNVISCERRFELQIKPNVILNGAMDLIREDSYNDGKILHVADYKTTKNKKYIKNDWFQLQTYAYVLLTENPKLEKIRASYILMRHNFEYITRDFLAEELLDTKREYIDYAEKMLSETEYAATTSVLCGFCDHLDICVEGKAKVNPKQTNGQVSW